MPCLADRGGGSGWCGSRSGSRNYLDGPNSAPKYAAIGGDRESTAAARDIMRLGYRVGVDCSLDPRCPASMEAVERRCKVRCARRNGPVGWWRDWERVCRTVQSVQCDGKQPRLSRRRHCPRRVSVWTS